jgi:hypothetical protein
MEKFRKKLRIARLLPVPMLIVVVIVSGRLYGDNTDFNPVVLWILSAFLMALLVAIICLLSQRCPECGARVIGIRQMYRTVPKHCRNCGLEFEKRAEEHQDGKPDRERGER